jgi:Zn-dependent M28 family amino/carboxypeptidase
VRGHFLNDLHLAVALRRARDSGWVVRTNPYEGGSDHTVFTKAGIPALLNWHFTDRYYHSNLDTVDKTSAATMGHVATTVATSSLFLASANASDGAALVALVNEAERMRLATEERNAASAEIVAAWKKWYAEARASVSAVAR